MCFTYINYSRALWYALSLFLFIGEETEDHWNKVACLSKQNKEIMEKAECTLQMLAFFYSPILATGREKKVADIEK